MKNMIRIKYTIISFILGLIPFIIVLSFINSNPKHTILHTSTIICFAIITAIANMIYTYISIGIRLNKKTSQM